MEKEPNNTDGLSEISAALVSNNWLGTELLFYFQQNPNLPFRNVIEYSEVKQLSPADVVESLDKLSKAGLITQNDTHEIQLSGSGKELANLLTGFLNKEASPPTTG